MTTKKTTRKKATKKTRAKSKGGRPTVYRAEFAQLAFNYSLMGAIDKDLAGFFNVSDKTIDNWKNRHPEFLLSIRGGKEKADATIAQSLYHRANGYSHLEEKIFNNGGEIVRAQTMKHYPPDTKACEFWLKNRQPDMWREKVEIDTTGMGAFKDTEVDGMNREEALAYIGDLVNQLPLAQRAALGEVLTIH